MLFELDSMKVQGFQGRDRESPSARGTSVRKGLEASTALAQQPEGYPSLAGLCVAAGWSLTVEVLNAQLRSMAFILKASCDQLDCLSFFKNHYQDKHYCGNQQARIIKLS